MTDFNCNTSNFIINISSSSHVQVMSIVLQVSIADAFFTSFFYFLFHEVEEKFFVMQYWRYIYAVIYLFSLFFFSRIRVLMDWGHLSTQTMCALVIFNLIVFKIIYSIHKSIPNQFKVIEASEIQ